MAEVPAASSLPSDRCVVMMNENSGDSLKFDTRGLVPAVVQDADSRRVLMVAYLDHQALHKTLTSGEAWFWSRSRCELWHKGDRSGNVLNRLKVLTDCDRDCLLLLVRETDQMTPICHTGLESCFGWTVRLADGIIEVSPDEVEQRGYVADAAEGEFAGLKRIVARLRRDDGCPWERKQTFRSTKPRLIDETYEVVEAIDAGDVGALREELGDLMLQVLLLSQIAAERDAFDVHDVIAAAADKLVDRHASIVPDLRSDRGRQCFDSDERIEEAGRDKLSSIPSSLPALMFCQKLLRRSWRIGMAAVPSVATAAGELSKLAKRLESSVEEGRHEAAQDVVECLLWQVSLAAQLMDVDAEDVLRRRCLTLRRSGQLDAQRENPGGAA